jgi:hypothetical protein
MSVQNSLPSELEQSWSAALEQANTQITANIDHSMPHGRVATAAEIASIIDYVQRCEDYIRGTYEQVALRLKELGLSRLFERMQAIVSDLRGAEQVYKQMHSSALAAQEQITRIQQESAHAWIGAMEDTMKRRQDMFDQHNRQWSANFNKVCVHCGYSLGDSYYVYDICPKCGRLLRGALL